MTVSRFEVHVLSNMYVLAVLLLIIGSTVSDSVTPRIVGGQDAEDCKYPYQVLILVDNFPFCGGSIINQRFILTAAHCIYEENVSKITIFVGSTKIEKPRAIYEADVLIWHKNYDSKNYSNDIGLIRVKENITYDEYVQPITLGSKYDVAPGETAVVTGWGRLSANIPVIPVTLQEIYVSVIQQQECQKIYPQLTVNNICTFLSVNKGLCMGDSGGPLVVKGEQVGIVSYGYPCALGVPDVYTRVFPYRNWIADVVKTWSAGSQVNTNTWTILLLVVSVILTRLYSLM